MTWIYAIPAWLFMSASVIGACALACGLLALVRHRMTRNEQITHNDVAGPILTLIGTVLAVMMSFMVVGVWQEYDNAAQTVQQEASALSDLHHLADAYPSGVRAQLQNTIDKYIALAVNQEWPAMKHGGESAAAHETAYAIAHIVNTWRPSNATDLSLQDRGIDRVGQFLDRRRDRILANRQGIPMILWATMLFTGTVTVAFSFYFRVDRPKAQYLMVIAETAVIAIIFTLIAELDYPFRGDIAVEPYSFVHIMQALHGVIQG
ncbi:MAG TPA: hypothetical protein VIO32_09625 [Candidatus Baltobacteraceae bacterium]